MPPEIIQLQQENLQLRLRIQILEVLFAALVKSDNYYFGKHITFADGMNIAMNTGTGTKIGTATGQKLGFWNTIPVIQPSSTGQATGFTAGGGTAVTHTSTFTGGSGSTAYTIGDIIKHLKAVGLLTS